MDIGGILSNVVNKFLLEGFFGVERTWRAVCAVRDVSDFKTVTSYRLIGKDQYELVAPGGELKHGALGGEQYTNKADTYGLLLAIDQRDIINDDLGAVTRVPRKLGRGSGLKINDVFWGVFLSNAAFFKADHANYFEGSDTALTVDGLTAAEVLFGEQTRPGGRPLGIPASILLVPTALKVPAELLMKSLLLNETTTANKGKPATNPHVGKFEVASSVYLASAGFTGASAKAWYLFADPNRLPAVEVAFLNGVDRPTVEKTDADFNTLGIQFRGYIDFGVREQDQSGTRLEVAFTWHRGEVTAVA